MSLFGGMLGLDYFYLGLPMIGLAKLLSLGGFGFWWLLDIVRMGAGPVYSQNFRVAADLPRSVFVLVTVATFALLGLLYAVKSSSSLRARKRQTAMHAGEEARMWPQAEEDPARGSAGGFRGYGTTLPAASRGGPRTFYEVRRHAALGHRC